MAGWIIAGLGNPGTRYALTRHNIGFVVVEILSRRHGIRILDSPRHESRIGAGAIAGRPVILAEPLTFMNISGRAVASLLRNRPDDTELIVIHDDLDLEPGRIRIRRGGSAGGHKGVEDIIRRLGRDDFLRIRIGVGRPPVGVPVTDFVLTSFTPEERGIMDEAAGLAAEAVEAVLSTGETRAMNLFNVSPKSGKGANRDAKKTDG